MRITGGTLKGRLIACPPGEIRPAMDRMRESFFAVLGDLSGLSFLDLFSGSGIIGIEAWSRSARPVVMVEKDPGKRRVLIENAELCEGDAAVKIMPVERFIMAWKASSDIVFMDPPFPYRFKRQLLESASKSRILHDRSLLLIHFPIEDKLPERCGGLEVEDERRYGRSVVRFYRMTAGNEDPADKTSENEAPLTTKAEL
jgi:16S rRNA (guanine966-N2)-methyltransferase